MKSENISEVSNYIKDLIKNGEGQHLDFKYAITDSPKIARSLVAFSNSRGGRLLIGVKDNGSIAGVRSEEEYYMVEAAAQIYSKPEIRFESREWKVDGRTVLEIIIPKSQTIPHRAPNHEGKWMAYIRVADQNLLANRILMNVWKRQDQKVGIRINYTENEKALLNYLKDHTQITLSKYCRIAHLSLNKAEKILVDFILLKIIKMVFTEKQVYYELCEQEFEIQQELQP